MSKLESWARSFYISPPEKQPTGVMKRRIPFLLNQYDGLKLFSVQWEDTLGDRWDIPNVYYIWNDDECVLATTDYYAALRKYDELKSEINNLESVK